ncbi:NAD-dependent epimerase/dehydratase family protein [Pseudonocardia kujensis]|uniref:NAD-dependent epimerase/dehydratase family protein n=1 Tax=Pseudonocardia kujensis TaxID=1128675 RepID=UPI001E404A08|nr:NAD-dependent epimerase/dehydratase family protein [Pseudonocardia kujensis]MCE0763361.1 NAD-dependent epimerase/dehydratase family protein [Pseudonocardia kujensis]
MKVIVTGATGFVGYALAAALVGAGHEVAALTRSKRELPTNVRRVEAELLDAPTVAAAMKAERPDAVCHLAALVRVRDSRADPVGYWQTNVGGTLALLGALAAQDGPARLVAASTCAVYGEDVPQPISEAQIPQPTNPYGSTKLAADRAIADVAATGAIGAVSLRAFNIAGGIGNHADPDTSRLIPKIIAVARGEAPELTVNGDGSAVRDYLHVADMVDAFVRALDACEPGTWKAYNVGSGNRSTIADVIAAVEEVIGRPLPVRHNPPADEPKVLLADPSRIEKDLGWRPERSDLRQIVRDAYNAVTSRDSVSE